jgi:SAM-dependent methyltransferase
MVKDVCVEVVKNAAMSLPAVRRRRLKRPRAEVPDVSAVDRYAFALLRLLEKVGVTVAGKRVAEIGPGDHLASGLVFLAAGATSYTTIDRFPADYSGEYAKQWYERVRLEWPARLPKIPWPAYLDRFPSLENVETIPSAIERLHYVGERFDIVCSFQVGEHVSDISAFAAKTGELIAPDGVAVHLIDFGPHGPWGRYDDPTLFLRFPGWLWRLMGSARGIPNRKRPHEFEAAFQTAELEVRQVGQGPFKTIYVCRHR